MSVCFYTCSVHATHLFHSVQTHIESSHEPLTTSYRILRIKLACTLRERYQRYPASVTSVIQRIDTFSMLSCDVESPIRSVPHGARVLLCAARCRNRTCGQLALFRVCSSCCLPSGGSSAGSLLLSSKQPQHITDDRFTVTADVRLSLLLPTGTGRRHRTYGALGHHRHSFPASAVDPLRANTRRGARTLPRTWVVPTTHGTFREPFSGAARVLGGPILKTGES